VSTSGGFGLAGRATPGAGRTSTGGGSGGTCWLTTGISGGLAEEGLATGTLAAGAFAPCGAAGGREVGIFGLGAAAGGWMGLRGIEAGAADVGASPRSIKSSRLVSRSIVLTASHDDKAVTSTLR